MSGPIRPAAMLLAALLAAPPAYGKGAGIHSTGSTPRSLSGHVVPHGHPVRVHGAYKRPAPALIAKNRIVPARLPARVPARLAALGAGAIQRKKPSGTATQPRSSGTATQPRPSSTPAEDEETQAATLLASAEELAKTLPSNAGTSQEIVNSIRQTCELILRRFPNTQSVDGAKLLLDLLP